MTSIGMYGLLSLRKIVYAIRMYVAGAHRKTKPNKNPIE